MSQESIITAKLHFHMECEEINPHTAFRMALIKLQSTANSSELIDVKKLLCKAGFSRNACNRISYLSKTEINYLCVNIPNDESLWHSYTIEIQTLLSKMEQERKGNASDFGRPYVTVKQRAILSRISG